MTTTTDDSDYNLALRFLDPPPGERTALVTAAGATTYAQLRAMVGRVGNALRARGVGKGDRVLISLRDGVAYLATWYAAQRIGAVTVDLCNFLPPDDYSHYDGYVEPAIIVTDGDALGAFRAGGVRGMAVLPPYSGALRADEIDFQALVDAQSAELTATPMAAGDEAIWKLTTGSTGKPKACRHVARSPWLSHRWFAEDVLGLGPDDVIMPVPKMFSGWARDLVALYAMGAGASAILYPERTTPELIFELVARHRPTVLVNVPTMMKSMLAHPEAKKADLSSLRMCLSAGEQLPVELHRRWLDTFGVEVLDCVGSSEAFNAIICNRPGQVRFGSLGQIIPHYEAHVTDEHGRPLPDGEVGVLQVTGEPVARDYWKAPEKTAATFPSPGTLRTGDLFTRDADGYYYYRGRADDLLKVGGMYVAPTEIENCLLTHPAVITCALVGFTTPDGLTSTRAHVVVSRPVPAAELQEYVKTRLSPHKYPREIRFAESLPETPTGKIDRNALRARD
ncbi:benzoate-CoA ligase family protein [Nonomuraea longicatena]|uniref:Benzoate-CoA ligase family protein n=1 Tax=Nonomuraea longicatena TaxID=83682 RepID=A0ABN1QVZ1_9ACTN